VRRYSVRRAAEVTRDLDRIEEWLANVYHDFGDNHQSATERAAARIEDALSFMRTFAMNPHRGTEHPAVRPGLRSVTSKSARSGRT
jgi:plasmid stabilization system protein ParE